MPVDAKQYVTELAQKAGLDQSTTDAILKAAENPNFAKELSDSVMRQSEFSRSMDTLKSQEAALLDNQAKWKKWHDDNLGYVKELETKAGLPNKGAGNGEHTGLSMEDVAKQIKEATDRAVSINVNITKQASRVVDDYRARFGKPLDLDALEKLALEKNLTISAAYDEMIKPEADAKQKEAHEKELKEAGEKAVAEYASKHNLPTDTGPAEPAPFFAPKTDGQPLTEGQRARNFAESWSQNAGS